MVTWTRAERAAAAYHGTAWAGLDEPARRWEIGRMIAALAASDGPAIPSTDDRRLTTVAFPADGDLFHHPV